METKIKLWNIIDIAFVLFAILGVLIVVWQGICNKHQDVRIIAMSFLPFLLNKIIMALVEKETIIQGVPKVVSLYKNKILYWFITLVYTTFFLFCLIYLLLTAR